MIMSSTAKSLGEELAHNHIGQLTTALEICRRELLNEKLLNSRLDEQAKQISSAFEIDKEVSSLTLNCFSVIDLGPSAIASLLEEFLYNKLGLDIRLGFCIKLNYSWQLIGRNGVNSYEVELHQFEGIGGVHSSKPLCRLWEQLSVDAIQAADIKPLVEYLPINASCGWLVWFGSSAIDNTVEAEAVFDRLYTVYRRHLESSATVCVGSYASLVEKRDLRLSASCGAIASRICHVLYEHSVGATAHYGTQDTAKIFSKKIPAFIGSSHHEIHQHWKSSLNKWERLQKLLHSWLKESGCDSCEFFLVAGASHPSSASAAQSLHVIRLCDSAAEEDGSDPVNRAANEHRPTLRAHKLVDACDSLVTTSMCINEPLLSDVNMQQKAGGDDSEGTTTMGGKTISGSLRPSRQPRLDNPKAFRAYKNEPWDQMQQTHGRAASGGLSCLRPFFNLHSDIDVGFSKGMEAEILNEFDDNAKLAMTSEGSILTVPLWDFSVSEDEVAAADDGNHKESSTSPDSGQATKIVLDERSGGVLVFRWWGSRVDEETVDFILAVAASISSILKAWFLDDRQLQAFSLPLIGDSGPNVFYNDVKSPFGRLLHSFVAAVHEFCPLQHLSAASAGFDNNSYRDKNHDHTPLMQTARVPMRRWDATSSWLLGSHETVVQALSEALSLTEFNSLVLAKLVGVYN
jgi:hypothetical protein